MLAPAQKEADEQFSFRSAELPGLLSVILDGNCLEESPQCPSPEAHPKHHTFQELPSLLSNINTVTVPVMSITSIKSTKVSPRKSPVCALQVARLQNPSSVAGFTNSRHFWAANKAC